MVFYNGLSIVLTVCYAFSIAPVASLPLVSRPADYSFDIQ